MVFHLMLSTIALLIATPTTFAQIASTAVGGKVHFGQPSNETLIYLKCVDENWTANMPAGSVCMNFIFMHHTSRGSVPISNKSTDPKTAIGLKAIIEDLPRDLWTWVQPKKKSKQQLTSIVMALHSNFPNVYYEIENRKTYDALLTVLRNWIDYKITQNVDLSALKPTLVTLGNKETFQEMVINSDSADPRQNWIQVGADGAAMKHARPYLDVNLQNSGEEEDIQGLLSAKTDFSRTNINAMGLSLEDACSLGILFRIDSGPYAKHMGLGFVIGTKRNLSKKILVRAYILPLQWGNYTTSEQVMTTLSQNLLQGFTTVPGDLIRTNVYSPGLGIQTRIELLPQIEFTLDADAKTQLFKGFTTERNEEYGADETRGISINTYNNQLSQMTLDGTHIQYFEKSRLKRTAFTTDASLLFNLKSGLGISFGAYAQITKISGTFKGEIKKINRNTSYIYYPKYDSTPFDNRASRFDHKVFGRVTLLYKF